MEWERLSSHFELLHHQTFDDPVPPLNLRSVRHLPLCETAQVICDESRAEQKKLRS